MQPVKPQLIYHPSGGKKIISNRLCRMRNHSFLYNCVLLSYSFKVKKFLPAFNLNPCWCSAWCLRRRGLYLSSLWTSTCCRPLPLGEICSPTRWRGCAGGCGRWEPGGGFSCWAAPGSWGHLSQGLRFALGAAAGERQKSKGTINGRLHPRGVCAASLIHEMLFRWYVGQCFYILIVT